MHKNSSGNEFEIKNFTTSQLTFAANAFQAFLQRYRYAYSAIIFFFRIRSQASFTDTSSLKSVWKTQRFFNEARSSRFRLRLILLCYKTQHACGSRSCSFDNEDKKQMEEK